MSDLEPKTVFIAPDNMYFDEEKLARGGKFISIPVPKRPTGLKKFWVRLRVALYTWKQHFTRHAPSRARRVYITPVGDIVIYSWRSLSSMEAHTALLSAENAERALRAGELGVWS